MTEHPADDKAVLQQIVKDHHGLGIRGGRGIAGLLAAQGVERTDDCEMHSASLNENRSHLQTHRRAGQFIVGPTERCARQLRRDARELPRQL